MDTEQIDLEGVRLARAYVQGTVRQFEEKWGILIEVDFAILEEAYARSLESLRTIELSQPDHIKQAAHVCYWIRRLKPLNVVNLQSFNDMFVEFSERGLIRGELHYVDRTFLVPTKAKFLNETFAVIIAKAIVEDFGDSLKLNAEQLNDLAVTLRYHTISLSALVMIIAAFVGASSGRAA